MWARSFQILNSLDHFVMRGEYENNMVDIPYTGVKIQGYDDSDEIREGSALKYAPLPRPCAFQHHTLLSHLLTYIFNFPVDTLNKNFMKIVGGCAMKGEGSS